VAAIVLSLSACANPHPAPTPAVNAAAQAVIASIQLRLPPRYEAWRPALEQDLREMAIAFPEVTSRWRDPAAPPVPPSPRQLVVTADGFLAAALYRELGLEGEAEVPRTFPRQGLAIVPLPRDDRLLANRLEPPQTWRHSFRHELAHLLSLDDSVLRTAPDWFQEGFAEAWCVGRPDQPLAAAWPFPLSLDRWWQQDFATAPAEVRYAALAAQVRRLLSTASVRPWSEQLAFQGAGEAHQKPFQGLRGREAAWNLVAGDYLLATRPLEQVDLDLPWTWNGSSPLPLELQLGRTGEPEAGLLLRPAGAADSQGPRLRLRFQRLGGLALYPEAAGTPARFEAVEDPPGEPRPGVRRHLQLAQRDGMLVVTADGFRRAVDLAANGLAFPLELQLYVRDGAFLAHIPAPATP